MLSSSGGVRPGHFLKSVPCRRFRHRKGEGRGTRLSLIQVLQLHRQYESSRVANPAAVR